MNAEQLKNIRLEIKFSMQDVANFLSIPKSTYQRYENGSACVPADVATKMTEYRKKDKAWKRAMIKKLEADLAKRFPLGIISEAV